MANKINDIWIRGDGAVVVQYTHVGKIYIRDKQIEIGLGLIMEGWRLVFRKAKYFTERDKQKIRQYTEFVKRLGNEYKVQKN